MIEAKNSIEIATAASNVQLAKDRLADAKKQLEKAETKLLDLVPYPEEGKGVTIVGDLSIEITGKLNRTLDADGLEDTLKDLPPSYQDVVNLKPALNLKRFRELKQHEGDAFFMFAKHVTTKPGKPSIKIEVIGDETDGD